MSSKTKSKYYIDIGRILKEERKKAGYSLDRLAELIGESKSKSTLKRYEDGKSRPDLDTLSSICAELNIDMNDVISRAQKEAGMEVVKNAALSSNEIRLINMYRRIPKYHQSNAFEMIALYFLNDNIDAIDEFGGDRYIEYIQNLPLDVTPIEED
ncbi:MAG: helix-turn-helix transcriptional regulator [Lachnospiraceae bacterium]|nr:helix-turn-helix transcriptional regulator [Lachnospiraceae bacterium]